MHAVVREYLAHYGYAATLRALDAAQEAPHGATAVLPERTAALLVDCDSIRRSLCAGDVDAAEAHIRARCPGVLEEARGEVAYVLACSRYIELVRGGRLSQAVAFARESLGAFKGAPACSAHYEADLQELAGLLAYGQPAASPLAPLLSWQQKELAADLVCVAIRRYQASGNAAEPVQCILASAVAQLLTAHGELRSAQGGHGPEMKISSLTAAT